MTHAYSAEDMAAIMGGFAPPVIAEIKAEKPAESSGKSGYESDDSDSDADAKSKKKKGACERRAPPPPPQACRAG